MDKWECLRALLEQNHFDLIGFETVTPQEDGTDCRLIYLMNDAVESFLIFRNVRYTGTYRENYDGDLDYALIPEENCIRVDQGDSHLLLFFDELELETHFYNYGEIGHFWVKGHEDLRVLEYQIAIIADKLEYLGADACNPLERKIASLKHFPPLNYTCYPSASSDYVFPMEDPWEVSGEALDFMEELCGRAGDRVMLRMIAKYRRTPSVRMGKKIAGCLTRSRHGKLLELLRKCIAKAAGAYPKRTFGAEEDRRMAEALERACRIRQSYLDKGIHARIYREEPFVYDCDSIGFGIWLMVLENGFFRRRVKVRRLDGNEEKHREAMR